jgi:hypothetical protein
MKVQRSRKVNDDELYNLVTLPPRIKQLPITDRRLGAPKLIKTQYHDLNSVTGPPKPSITFPIHHR